MYWIVIFCCFSNAQETPNFNTCNCAICKWNILSLHFYFSTLWIESHYLFYLILNMAEGVQLLYLYKDKYMRNSRVRAKYFCVFRNIEEIVGSKLVVIFQRLVPCVGGRFDIGLQYLHKVPHLNLVSIGIKWLTMTPIWCTVSALQYLYYISVLLVIFTEPCLEKQKHKDVFKNDLVFLLFLWSCPVYLDIITVYF